MKIVITYSNIFKWNVFLVDPDVNFQGRQQISHSYDNREDAVSFANSIKEATIEVDD